MQHAACRQWRHVTCIVAVISLFAVTVGDGGGSSSSSSSLAAAAPGRVTSLSDLADDIAAIMDDVGVAAGEARDGIDAMAMAMDDGRHAHLGAAARSSTLDLVASYAELHRLAGRLARSRFADTFAAALHDGNAPRALAFMRVQQVHVTTFVSEERRAVSQWRQLCDELGRSARDPPPDGNVADDVAAAVLDWHWRVLVAIAAVCATAFGLRRRAVLYAAVFASVYLAGVYCYVHAMSMVSGLVGSSVMLLQRLPSMVTAPVPFVATPRLTDRMEPRVARLSVLTAALSTNFQVLSKGLSITLSHEGSIVPAMDDASESAALRANALAVLRRNAMLLMPRLSLAALRSRADDGDADARRLVRAADNVLATAAHVNDQFVAVMSDGLESIVGGDALLSRIALDARSDDAPELMRLMSTQYGALAASFDGVVSQIQSLQADLGRLQTDRDLALRAIRRWRLQSATGAGLGVALGIVGVAGAPLAATWTAVAGAAGVATVGAGVLVRSVASVVKAHRFASALDALGVELRSFRNDVARVRDAMTGAKTQVQGVVSMLALAQQEMNALGLAYEPVSARARQGLDVLYAAARDEQRELLRVLGLLRTFELATGDGRNVPLTSSDHVN